MLLLIRFARSSIDYSDRFSRKMADSDSDEYDSDEVNKAYEEAKASLQDRTVKCVNSDGTFRCPYSPGRKKQDYKYSEILQHAVGVVKGSGALYLLESIVP